MTREIKFKIFYDNKIVGYERLSNTGWEWMALDLNPDNGERWSNGVFPQNEKYKRYEFTGFTDKNGIEIYEDSVISSKPYIPQNESERIISKVVFREDLGRWNAECFGKLEGETDHLYEVNKSPHETEVIGNVYENPELLTS